MSNSIIVSANIINSSGTAQTVGNGDQLFLEQDTVISGSTFGIFGDSSATSVDMEIDGTVQGGIVSVLDAGIELDGSGALITVGKTGEVFGMLGDAVLLKGFGATITNLGDVTASVANGVDLLADETVNNFGTIRGKNYGVVMSGADNVINNTGIIDGHYGVYQFNAGDLQVTNSGTISGDGAVNFQTPNGQVSYLSNSGSLLSKNGAYEGVTEAGGGELDIHNSGLISAQGNDAIQSFSGGAIKLINSGEIEGWVGIGFSATSGDRLTNSGSGTIEGDLNGVNGAGALTAVNHGEISGGTTGIQFNAATGTNLLTNTGTIEGGTYGVLETGAAGLTVTNSGSIDGGTAIQFSTTSGEDFLVNSGLITAVQTAVMANAGGALSVTNSGTISGFVAIQFDTQAGHLDSLYNTGTIETSEPGMTAITQFGTGALAIDNEGHISGAIIFAGVNDVYDGTLGTVSGPVNGGSGDDVLTGGAGTDSLNGSDGNDVLTGNGGNDILVASKGNDTLSGGAGDDSLVLNNGLNTADVIDGGDGRDVMTIAGVYAAPIVFVDGEVSNVEVIRFGGGHSFNVTTSDDMVAAGGKFTINATAMTATDTLVFNGAAETDGHFNIVGGLGNDTLGGGDGADTMNGNGGNDVFLYQDVSQSTGLGHDKIVGYDATAEKFDLDVTVTGINTAFSGGKLTTANFDANLTAAVNAAHLAAGHAVLFTATAGSLSGHTFLVVDANGTVGYQAGQDYVMEISGGTHLASLSAADFI